MASIGFQNLERSPGQGGVTSRMYPLHPVRRFFCGDGVRSWAREGREGRTKKGNRGEEGVRDEEAAEAGEPGRAGVQEGPGAARAGQGGFCSARMGWGQAPAGGLWGALPSTFLL